MEMFYDKILIENIKKQIYISRKISPVIFFIHKLIIKTLNYFNLKKNTTEYI